MNDTIVKIKLWGVIGLFAAILAYFFVSGMGMESRVTKCETSISYIVSSLEEMKGMIKEIRQDQIRRERTEKNDTGT